MGIFPRTEKRKISSSSFFFIFTQKDHHGIIITINCGSQEVNGT